MRVKPYFRRAVDASDVSPARRARAAGSSSWSVPDLCAAYQWPTSLPGGGTIAVVELGGGWIAADMAAYFQSIRQPCPSIVDVSVDGTQNSPGQDADGEVALDVQVAAAAYYVATGRVADVRIYWARDIAVAVRAAARDGCAVCSVSWGADEETWGEEAARDMEAAAAEAVVAGMVVLAAAGDNDSGDGGSGPANVDLPAGCPSVVGCGGTTKTRVAEWVWNDTPGNPGGDGTGGGYSRFFAMPDWQRGRAPAGPGRLVPDVAACADPATGYEIYCHGGTRVVGGTSAVAPLYAGLVAACGRRLASDLPARLWSSSGVFVDVTRGDNGKFHATAGPDPCTGLGAPVGLRLAALLSSTVPAAAAPSPAPATPHVVTLDQALAWAQSAIPDVPMTRVTVLKFIERGLRQSWPTPA